MRSVTLFGQHQIVLPAVILLAIAISADSTAHAQTTNSVPATGAVVTVAQRTASIPALTLQQPAAMDIGGTLDNPDDEFIHRNGFLHALRLSDGALAVIDSWKLRIYEKSGKPRVVVGKIAGDGPNEFRNLYRICATRGDTMVILDLGNGRVSVVSSAGKIVRQFVSKEIDVVNNGCLSDGTFLVRRMTGQQDGRRIGQLIRRSTSNADQGVVGVFPIGFTSIGVAPITTLAYKDHIVVADPTRPDILVYDLSGRLVQTYRLSEPLRTMTADEATFDAPVGVRGAPAGPPAGALPSASSTRPLYKRILFDPAGNLWLQDMVFDRTVPQQWVRISTTGKLTGRLTLPPLDDKKAKESTDVQQFMTNSVLLLVRDSDGAVHFRTHDFK